MPLAPEREAVPASFRDPDGFVFERDGVLYRHVAPAYAGDYHRLTESGLYDELAGDGLLVPHEDLGADALTGARTLRPERLPFVAHPYEWCFGQFQDAARATLAVQRQALARDMTLKDASAYNIAFRGARPVLFDTLSFTTYRPGRPWPAYRQFCEQFLAPLALMALRDVRLSGLLRVHLDGVPLDLASRLLPIRTRLNPALLMHLHLHAKAQQRGGSGGSGGSGGAGGVSKAALLGLLDSLEGAVNSLRYAPRGTVWADYYADTNYTEPAADAKRRLVAELLDAVPDPLRLVWDFGANDGRYSRLACERGAAFTVAWDVDPAAVELGWRAVKARGEANLLPLVQDLTNPSPDTGWEQRERASLLARGPADLVLALALVHHLALGHNVPLARVVRFLASSGRWVLVEWVPKSDGQARRLVVTKGDIFPAYTEDAFADALGASFEIVRRAPIPETRRTLFLCRRRG